MFRCKAHLVIFIWCLVQHDQQSVHSMTIQTCDNCAQDSMSCPPMLAASSGEMQCIQMCNGVSANEICVVNNTLETCMRYSCENIIPSDGSTLYRLSSVTDCPNFEIAYNHSYVGVCDVITSNTGVTSYYDCVIECFDMVGCRGFTYNITAATCEYHNCTESSMIAGATDVAFFSRTCKTPTAGCPLTQIRTCLNCGPSPECNIVYQGSTTMSNCESYSNNILINYTTSYSPHNNTCWYVANCKTMQRFDGRIFFRSSCQSACQKFTVFELPQHSGTCSIIQSMINVPSIDECLSTCLDIDGCLGVTFDSLLKFCVYHDCVNSTDTGSMSSTFVGLKCDNEVCNVTYTQTCTDCRHSSTCLQLPDISYPASSSNCKVVALESPGIIGSSYDLETSLCSTYDCGALESMEESIAFRKSCSIDCPNYKLEVLWRHIPLGHNISTDYNVTSLQICMELCLDMDGCRGALYNSAHDSCTYYNSSEWVYADTALDVTFITRICDYTKCFRAEYQTCINCRLISECQPKQQYIDIDKIDCENVCTSKTEKSCVYNPYYRQCRVHEIQCSKIEIFDGRTTFRKTCTTDCPLFHLQELIGHVGTCNILTAQWNVTSTNGCINRCLDMEGCRGVTYNSTESGCYYHNCSATSDTLDTTITFYKRECNFQPEPNCTNQTYFQTCINCKPADSCVEYTDDFHGTPLVSHCESACEDILTTSMCTFGPYGGQCSAYYDCNHIEPTEGHVTIRKTCSSDCPSFKLTVMPGFEGNCNVISTEAITSYIDCQQRCLDMDGCRGATYSPADNTCTYHNCSTYIGSLSNQTFIQRDCDYQDCERNFTKSCKRCTKSTLCGQNVLSVAPIELDYTCRDMCRNMTNCTSTIYRRRSDRCLMADCTLLDYYARGDIQVYRESCNDDCPEFDFKVYHDTKGDMCVPLDDSGFDVILDFQHCLSRCLDIVNCRATTYDSVANSCTFYQSCANTSTSVGDKYVEITCVSEPLRLNTQKCYHCDLDYVECNSNFTYGATYTTHNACAERCDNYTDCLTAVYDGKPAVECFLYQCPLTVRSYGKVTFRKTNTSDCLEYEIRFYEGFSGGCSVLGEMTTESSASYCFSRCLELSACKGITFDTLMYNCSLHTCNSMISALNTTVFWEKMCYPSHCVRNNTQLCIDCEASLHCQGPVSRFTTAMPSLMDPSVLDTNSTIQSISYEPDYDSAILFYDCHWINMALGHSVYRTACSSDCLKYEIFTVPAAVGMCTVMQTINGGISGPFCLEKCLDTPGCMGATYNKDAYRCDLHDCNNYTYAGASNSFFKRRCIDSSENCLSNITQTCINCRISNTCMKPFNGSKPVYFEHECLEMFQADNSSLITYYERDESYCGMYECSLVSSRVGHVVYRQSCNQDCPLSEIFVLASHNGTCDVIGFHEGGLNIDYCIEKCLDIDGCRGITFEEKLERCTYHTCSNSTDAGEKSWFVKKVCLEKIPPRTNVQTCFNCKRGSTCQARYYEGHIDDVYENCFQDVSTNDSISWAIMEHTDKQGRCRGYNCTFIEQDPLHYETIRRKSYASDCPNFDIYTIKHTAGSCGEIDRDDGHLKIDYCVAKCLDTLGCRGVTFTQKIGCTYHNCTDNNYNIYSTFIERKCFEPSDEPPKTLIQTCINCNSHCQLVLNQQNNVLKSNQCSFTLSKSRSLVYRWNTGGNCNEYNCDQPNLEARDSTVMRRTNNSDCLKFEVLALGYAYPVCTPMFTEFGVHYKYVCLHRCMDMPSCRAVQWRAYRHQCSYYNCTEYTQNILYQYNNIQLYLKECHNDSACISPTMQHCLNCEIEPGCQEPYQTVGPADDVLCASTCAGDNDCDSAALNVTTGICSLYQCDRIRQSSSAGAEVLRPSCDNTDCPIFELYTVNDQIGTCYPFLEEYNIDDASLCMKRCMNTPTCRAITYHESQLKCSFHRCDCSETTNVTTTFMWKYCLENVSNKTILPSNCTYDPYCNITSFYPREIVYCDTTTTTTTTTTPIPTTTVNWTALQIDAIFIWPCLCGTNEFINWTILEITNYLSNSLLIDKRYTSQARRLKESSTDDRTSVKVLGGSGVAILLGICIGVVTLDSGNWYISIMRFQRFVRHIIKYFRRRRLSSYNRRFSIFAEAAFEDDMIEGNENDATNQNNDGDDKPSSNKSKKNKYDVLEDPLDNVKNAN